MDHDTLQFYRKNAEAYAQREITSRHARMTRFLESLSPGAKILELGCGAGGDTAELIARGFDVRATDGSPELAGIAAKRLGRPVETLLFQDISEVAAYDAVWANACLLHVPRDQLADVLALICRALKPAGYFYASYKEGDAERARQPQSLLQLSIARLAARHLCAGWALEFSRDRERRGQRLRRQTGFDAVCRRAKSDLNQSTLKIASASMA